MLNSDALIGRTVTDQTMTEVVGDMGVVKAEYAHRDRFVFWFACEDLA